MKKLLLLIIILILISSTVLAYSGNTSNIQWRFLPSTGAATYIETGGHEFNSGDYPGTNFTDTTGDGYFQTYDLPENLVPVRPPGPGGGGGGGPGVITMAYTIMTAEEECINKPAKVRIINSLGQNAEGAAEIFYERNKRWIPQYKIMINGEFIFIPTEEANYKIVFGQNEKILKAKKCEEPEKEIPFAAVVKKEQKDWKWPVQQEKEEPQPEIIKQGITGKITQAIKSNINLGVASFIIILAIIILLVSFTRRKMKEQEYKPTFLEKVQKKKRKTSDERLDDLSKDIEKLKKKLGKL